MKVRGVGKVAHFAMKASRGVHQDLLRSSRFPQHRGSRGSRKGGCCAHAGDGAVDDRRVDLADGGLVAVAHDYGETTVVLQVVYRSG